MAGKYNIHPNYIDEILNLSNEKIKNKLDLIYKINKCCKELHDYRYDINIIPHLLIQ